MHHYQKILPLFLLYLIPIAFSSLPASAQVIPNYFGLNGQTPRIGPMPNWNIHLPEYTSGGPQIGYVTQDFGGQYGRETSLSYNGTQLVPFVNPTYYNLPFYNFDREFGNLSYSGSNGHYFKEIAANSEFHILKNDDAGSKMKAWLLQFRPNFRELPVGSTSSSASPLITPGAKENYIDIPIWAAIDHTYTDAEVGDLYNSQVDVKLKLTRFQFPIGAHVNGGEGIQDVNSSSSFLKSSSGPSYVYAYWQNTTNSAFNNSDGSGGDGKYYDILVAVSKDLRQDYLFGFASRNQETGYTQTREWDLIYCPKPKTWDCSDMLYDGVAQSQLQLKSKDLKRGTQDRYFNSFPFSIRLATLYVPNGSDRAEGDLVAERVGLMISDLGCGFTQNTGSLANPYPILTPPLTDQLPTAYKSLTGGGIGTRGGKAESNPNQWYFKFFANTFKTYHDEDVPTNTKLELYEPYLSAPGVTYSAYRLTQTQSIRNAFWDAMDAEADYTIQECSNASVVGPKASRVFVWDFEGMNRKEAAEGAEFTGNLKLLDYFAPEMLIRKDDVGLTAIENFITKLRQAQIDVAVTLRPEVHSPTDPVLKADEAIPFTTVIGYEPIPIDQVFWGDQKLAATAKATFIANMKEKIKYARDTYGITHFYVDQNVFENSPTIQKYDGSICAPLGYTTSYKIFGQYYRDLMQELHDEGVSDVVLYPEIGGGADAFYLSATAPYVESTSNDMTSVFNDALTGIYQSGRYGFFSKLGGAYNQVPTHAQSLRQQIDKHNAEFNYRLAVDGYEPSADLTPHIYQNLTVIPPTDVCTVTGASSIVRMPSQLRVARIANPGDDTQVQHVEPLVSTVAQTGGYLIVDVTAEVGAWGSFIYEWQFASNPCNNSWSTLAEGPFYVMDNSTVGYFRLAAWDVRNKNSTILYSPTYAIGAPVVAGCTDVPDISILGLSNTPIEDASTTILPNTTDGTDFGSVAVTSSTGSGDHGFTIQNPGAASLTLTGSSYVLKEGDNPGDFIITQPTSGSVAATGSEPFQINFKPTHPGVRSAIIKIESNVSGSKNPYTFKVQGIGLGPIMVVRGGTTATAPIIDDGDMTPDPSDETDFGTQAAGVRSIEQTFTMWNTGTADLVLTGALPYITVSGANPDDFLVTGPTGSTIASGASAEFKITFEPKREGLRTATVAIEFNDATVSPYEFAVQGVGLAPEIRVGGIVVADPASPIEIPSGSTPPSTGNGTDFGNVEVTSDFIERGFSVKDMGPGTLWLTLPWPRVQITGPDAADFEITTVPSFVVDQHNNTVFYIKFNPSHLGLHTATVTIENNDSDEEHYTFDIQGTGIAAPEMSVGSPTALGACNGCDIGYLGDFSLFSDNYFDFPVTNYGSQPLDVSDVFFDGVPADFTVVSPAPAAGAVSFSVAPGGSQTVTIRFKPSVSGGQFATLKLLSNDPDDPTYRIQMNAGGMGSTGGWQWVDEMTSTTEDRMNRLTAAPNGKDIYVTGYNQYGASFRDQFNKYQDFVPGYFGNPFSDAKVIAYKGDGSYQWVGAIIGEGEDRGVDIAMPTDGSHMIAVGNFTGKAEVVSGPMGYPARPLASTGIRELGVEDMDVYVSRWLPDSRATWGFNIGGVKDDEASAVYVDPLHNIYVSGRYREKCDFKGRNGVQLPVARAAFGQDGFLAKYDQKGTLEWVLFLESESDDDFTAIQGNGELILASAAFYPESRLIRIDVHGHETPIPLPENRGKADILALMFDPAGHVLMAHSIGDELDDVPRSIAQDKEGHLILTGYYESKRIQDELGLGIYNFSDHRDAFILSIKPEFTTRRMYLDWINGFGGEDDDEGYGVTVDEQNQIFYTGYFSGKAFANDNMANMLLATIGSSPKDVFGMQINTDGSSTVPFSAGAKGDDQGRGIANLPGSGILIAGNYSDGADFTPFTGLMEFGDIGGFVGLRSMDNLPPLTRFGSETTSGATSLLTVYPNPSAGKATVTVVNGSEGESVEVFSNLGVKVFAAPLSSDGTTLIDISRLPAGLYLVRSHGETASFVKE